MPIRSITTKWKNSAAGQPGVKFGKSKLPSTKALAGVCFVETGPVVALVLRTDAAWLGARHLHHDAAFARRSGPTDGRRPRQPIELRRGPIGAWPRSAASRAVLSLSGS